MLFIVNGPGIFLIFHINAEQSILVIVISVVAFARMEGEWKKESRRTHVAIVGGPVATISLGYYVWPLLFIMPIVADRWRRRN